MNQICAYMQPRSYLIEPINRILNALNSGGIFNKWMQDVAGMVGTPSAVENVWYTKSSQEPKPLTLIKLRLVFLILAIMYAMAFVVFLGEIIVQKIYTISRK